jgi:hypothetical protein
VTVKRIRSTSVGRVPHLTPAFWAQMPRSIGLSQPNAIVGKYFNADFLKRIHNR